MQPSNPPSSAEDAGPDRPPTILQVLPALDTGGVEQGTVDVAVATAEAGWRALVASAGGPKVYVIERAGGTHVTLPLDTKNPLKIWRNAARLAELIRREGVDIVHARSRAPAWSAYIAARRTGVRFLTTFHGTYNFKGRLKQRYNAVMANGERVIAISRFIAEHLKRHYAVPDSRIRVVQRGIDLRHFDPDGVAPERMIRLAHAWQLPDGVPVVMLPGRLTRWKGQLVLIDALARIVGREFICLLVGSDQGRTGYRDELTARVEARGLAGVHPRRLHRHARLLYARRRGRLRLHRSRGVRPDRGGSPGDGPPAGGERPWRGAGTGDRRRDRLSGRARRRRRACGRDRARPRP
jgi:glycosyltransferase involved in cell wall biosynthesis